MKRETRDTFMPLVAISLSIVCGCGLLILSWHRTPRRISRCPSLEAGRPFRKHPYQSLHLLVAVEEASKGGLMLPGSA